MAIETTTKGAANKRSPNNQDSIVPAPKTEQWRN